MAPWEERITQTTTPAIINEHRIRYRFAAEAIRESLIWADLGCGAGVAAEGLLQEPFAGKLVLVDLDEGAVREAQVLLRAHETAALRGDLTSLTDLKTVTDLLLRESQERPGCVTCFELIEHLPNFVPLLETLIELSRGDYTVVLSVPNDAFWSLDNPHHAARWSGAAFDEFRRNLPPDHVLALQFPLTGSCIQPVVSEPARITHDCAFEAGSDGVPSHYIAAFGPSAARLGSVAGVVQLDLDRQRAWERQREADLDYFRARVEQLEADRDRGAELRNGAVAGSPSDGSGAFDEQRTQG